VFRSSDLRASVTTFARGRRPFDSRSFLVVTSASTNATQLTEELAALPDEHSYFELDLGGAEVINEHLRELRRHRHALYTRETAATFCSGASYPGFPAPPLDRQEQAERILVGPLNTSDVAPILREAEARRNEPATAARLYGEVAERLRSAGFRGHALVLRQRPAGTSTSSDVSGATGSRGSRGSGFPFPRLRRAGSLSGGGPLGARPRAARPRGRRDRRPGQPGDRHPRRGRRRQLRRRSRHHPVHRHARRALPGRRDGDHALGPRRGRPTCSRPRTPTVPSRENLCLLCEPAAARARRTPRPAGLRNRAPRGGPRTGSEIQVDVQPSRIARPRHDRRRKALGQADNLAPGIKAGPRGCCPHEYHYGRPTSRKASAGRKTPGTRVPQAQRQLGQRHRFSSPVGCIADSRAGLFESARPAHLGPAATTANPVPQGEGSLDAR
jgi:hypothetical protein